PFTRPESADADAQEAAGSRPPEDLGSLEEVLEPQSEPPPSELAALELNPFGDEDDEITTNFNVQELERLEAESSAQNDESRGVLERLDELESDENERAQPLGEPVGLISRILGRK